MLKNQYLQNANPMKYADIREEELKNKVAQDYFWIYDCTKIIGNVDFCVCMHQSQAELFEQESLLWAEAKKGISDVYNSIVQLILTIGRARTFDKFLPPPMLGALDGEKIAFIPYSEISEIFYLNDFNWNVTPSDYSTKEFKRIHTTVKAIIDQQALLFNFDKDDKDLQKFIKANFVVGKFGLTKTKIDKNNFMVIYNKWLQAVKPTIAVDWDKAKKNGVIDGDFYLADLLSRENATLKDKLFVLLKHDHYELDRKIDEAGFDSHRSAQFNDNQTAHTQFWNRYDRPPKSEYWDYIVERRDLLVPQDVRERKGSFFTPQIWVELSQQYLTDVLGENWQDEYTVWDCAAGTGNLLTGLTNKYNIWASTLDTQDVDVMVERIDSMNKNSVSGSGANLLKDHVFQFDFLNDDFSKLPKALQAIINDPEKRKKLVIYINPPYAEASNRETVTGKGENKSNVATKTKVYENFHTALGTAARELFAQFFIRVYNEIPNSKLASFSTLKHINSQNFLKFRNYFKAKFDAGFIVPADTFDNVEGQFPIGFLIWDLNKREDIENINVSAFDSNENTLGNKRFSSYPKGGFIIDWLRKYYDKKDERIAYIRMQGTDMQNNRGLFFTTHPSENDFVMRLTADITKNNLMQMSIYLAVRHCIEATWLNDRDQFLHPNYGWETDVDFQNNCLAFTLFASQNRISSNDGINHWIPFTEQEVHAREKFDSNLMTQFLSGKLKQQKPTTLFDDQAQRTTPLAFSAEAQAVFNAGLALWQYYHQQPNCNVNASLYDIREHFQGRNAAGKMHNKSDDKTYMGLIKHLREQLKQLQKVIEPKIYEYGFLK
jgi:hypothetical protein